MRSADDCLCECHDPVERGSAAAPKIGDTLKPAEVRAALSEMEPPPGFGITRPSQAEREQWQCPHCDRLPFSTKHGVGVHIARMHRPDVPAVYASLPPEPDEFADVPGPAEHLEGELREMATEMMEVMAMPLADDVVNAIAFLEGKTREHIVDEALDEWAARTVNDDKDVRDLIALRRARRAGGKPT